MDSRYRWLKNPVTICLIIAHLAFLIIFSIRSLGILQSMELTAYDMLMRWRPMQAADPRIVIIGETEQDIQRWGHPLSDRVMATALEKLIAKKPRVIGVDKYRDIPVPPGSVDLDKVLQNNQNIIWILLFGTQGKNAIDPPAILKNSQQTGFNDVIDDSDGIVRRGLLFLDDGHKYATSFPLMLALRYLEPEGITLTGDEYQPDFVRLGRTTIPPLEKNDGAYINVDASGYQFLLSYPGMPARLKTFSLTDLLEERIPAEAVRDKIILFGSMAESLGDIVYTPFTRGQTDKQRLYFIEQHGYVTSQLVKFALGGKAAIRTISNHHETLWIWLWCISGGVAGLWLRAFWRFTLTNLIGLSLLSVICYVGSVYLWWIPLAPAAIGWFMATAMSTAFLSNREKQERQLLMQLFSRHVSSEVAEKIWHERDQFMHGGSLQPQRLTATVLFTDIKGFTSVSENMDPHALMHWLNTYMQTMADVVIRHQGNINKYIGDAIMAIFGVPVARKTEKDIKSDAKNAIDCALDMAEQLDEMNSNWQQQGLPTIGMRVGIYTGPLVAGSLGSKDRLEYTVIGDTVNTASRLESYDKGTDPSDDAHHCRILIGDNTLKYVEEFYETLEVGSVKLKGKEDNVVIFRVIKRR
jgi:adenylate cyclase